MTINFHENCLTPTNFTKYVANFSTHLELNLHNLRYKLGNFWKPLSYNFDSNKLKYISTIEAKKYPFVGVQFHPEKNIFEWATNTVGNIPHNKYTFDFYLMLLELFSWKSNFNYGTPIKWNSRQKSTQGLYSLNLLLARQRQTSMYNLIFIAF